ncbi:MAG: antitoxin VapB family protein [Candidatus Binatia bacterium]
MALKTITIDTEAYELLAREKRPGQSFSTVIKEHFGKRKTAATLLRALPSLALEEETFNHVEEQIKERRRSSARAPRL